MRKAEPNSAAAKAKLVTLAATKVRLANNFGGSNGELVLVCQKAKAITKRAPAMNDPSTSPLVQPAALPRTRPQVAPTAPAVMSDTPGTSMREAAPLDSWRKSGDSTVAITPIGTRSQKVQCQSRPCVTAPPMIGPAATPMPAMPPQSPITAPRLSGGNAAD